MYKFVCDNTFAEVDVAPFSDAELKELENILTKPPQNDTGELNISAYGLPVKKSSNLSPLAKKFSGMDAAGQQAALSALMEDQSDNQEALTAVHKRNVARSRADAGAAIAVMGASCFLGGAPGLVSLIFNAVQASCAIYSSLKSHRAIAKSEANFTP